MDSEVLFVMLFLIFIIVIAYIFISSKCNCSCGVREEFACSCANGTPKDNWWTYWCPGGGGAKAKLVGNNDMCKSCNPGYELEHYYYKTLRDNQGKWTYRNNCIPDPSYSAPLTCPSGKKVVSGTCVDCPSGTFKSGNNSSSNCSPCTTKCPAGEELNNPCSIRSGSNTATCTECPTGTYKSGYNENSCTPCKTDNECPVGQVIRNSCPAGSTSDTTECYHAPINCPAGKEEQYNANKYNGSNLPRGGPECVPCPQGKFKTGYNKNSCSPCKTSDSDCPSGQKLTNNPCPRGSRTDTTTCTTIQNSPAGGGGGGVSTLQNGGKDGAPPSGSNNYRQESNTIYLGYSAQPKKGYYPLGASSLFIYDLDDAIAECDSRNAVSDGQCGAIYEVKTGDQYTYFAVSLEEEMKVQNNISSDHDGKKRIFDYSNIIAVNENVEYKYLRNDIDYSAMPYGRKTNHYDLSNNRSGIGYLPKARNRLYATNLEEAIGICNTKDDCATIYDYSDTSGRMYYFYSRNNAEATLEQQRNNEGVISSGDDIDYWKSWSSRAKYRYPKNP